MRWLQVLLLFFASHLAQAQAAPDCTQAVSKLENYTLRVFDNNYAVAGFVRDISIAMNDWYIDYSSLEGQTVVVTRDYFSPLREAADEIGKTVNVAYEQLDTLDIEGQEIVDLVRTCLNPPSTP